MVDDDSAPSVLHCGPSRTAASSVSTHLNQIFRSSIPNKYSVVQFPVGSEGRDEVGWRKSIRLLSSPIALTMAIVRHKAQIVHPDTFIDAKAYWKDLTYMCVSKFLRRKVVCQTDGGKLPADFPGQTSAAQSFLRWTLSIPDIVVVLASIERDTYKQFGAVRRVEVIPNAIDLRDYSGMVERSCGEPAVRLGYIGRLSKDKGLKETIEALGAVRRRGFKPICLRIAGSGPYEKELRELVRIHLLEDSVDILGPVFGEHKIIFWRETDLFVFPSYRKGLPYVVLEALASGMPVISTRVGAITDVVQDGVQGLLVDTHDSPAVAAAIESLLFDRERLRSMSKAAFLRAREYYSLERLADQFDCLNQELLA